MPIPFGTPILTFATPAPVTATHPRPRNVMSAAACFHPSPLISISWYSNSPISSIRSWPGSKGGVRSFPMCFEVNSSALSESVGCSLILLATKNVKRNGLLSPISSTFASPPTRTHFPDATLNVIGSTFFFGTTILSSSGVRRSVRHPGTNKPGVSYNALPFPNSILMNLSVVPGRGEVVTDPFHLLAFPALFFPLKLSFLAGLFSSSKKFTRVLLPAFAAPTT
mmetsp:Transcript_6725/g.11254  ORF Transcript_6725/g.11254 Transcript_6725/m.11254 type:complete len:224 (+) Transcript_6725:152-823(+)